MAEWTGGCAEPASALPPKTFSSSAASGAAARATEAPPAAGADSSDASGHSTVYARRRDDLLARISFLRSRSRRSLIRPARSTTAFIVCSAPTSASSGASAGGQFPAVLEDDDEVSGIRTVDELEEQRDERIDDGCGLERHAGG